MAINKETLQLDVISNIDKILGSLKSSAEHIKTMSTKGIEVDEKFIKLETTLHEINKVLKQIGSGTIFDQLLGAQNKLNAAQKKTLEQYRAMDAAQNYTHKTNLSRLDDERLKYTLVGQTQKLIAAERLVIEKTNVTTQRSVQLERDKLDSVTKEIERRKTLENDKRKAEIAADKAAKKAIADSEKLARQQESAAKKTQMLSDKASKPFVYNNANDIARMDAKRNDPAYQKSRMALRLQETLGDGGAGLFKIQAGLLANYTLMNTFFSTMSFGRQFVMELDNSLHDLQAITATTEGNMEGLRQKIIEVSEGTKFTAVEVSNAAKILGQAGFSTNQIKEAISGVTLLATATGSSLEEAADTASSVISVFKLRAEDMTHVSNVMTEAINKSKLTMEKLALGLQYAGNIAAESGLTFEETTAILGAMSNAGIKSGSTLGTGLRQVLIEMQNPTEKFKKNLEDVGLTMQDVDVKSNGFVGVMNKLRNAGFDSAKAFESFEVRSAAAFAAIQNNPEMITELSEAFIYTNAAVEANNVQMKSLTNTSAVLRNNFGLLINDISGPVTTALKGFFNILSSTLSFLREYPAVLATIGTAITSLASVFVASRLILLVGNLTKGMFALGAATTALNGASIAGASSALLLGRGLLAALGPIGIAAAVLSTVVGGIVLFSDASSELTEAIEKSKSAIENSNGEFEKTGSSITTLEDNLGRLTDRFVELKKNPEELRLETIKMQSQFTQLGLTLKNGTSSSIYELIEALKTLRQELNKTATEQLQRTMAQNAVLFRQQALNARNNIKENSRAVDHVDLFGSATAGEDPLFQEGLKIKARAAKMAGTLSSVNLLDLNETELLALKNTLNEIKVEQDQFKGVLDTEASRLKLIQGGLSKGQQALLDTYTSFSETTSNDMVEINNLLLTATEAASQKLQVAASEIRSTDVAEAINYRIEKLRINISEIKNEVNGGTDAEKQDAVKDIQKQIADLRSQLREIIASYLFDDIEYFQMNLLDEMAIDSYIDDNFGAVAASATTYGKDAVNRLKGELEASAKKSSEAFNTAMQMAKDGFDVIKETYDDIGRKFDARIKSYQNIVDGNSNPYSGTFGQYTDAEVENIKKTQYKTEVNKTKTRLNALPGLISNLDGVISKQSKAPIALDANGNSIKSSVSANKELNALVKQKNELIAEQNALQAEYNTMMGTTEAHMTFGEQIQATIQDYAKVQNAQSSWASNIKENLTGAFDGAKASFSDMVFGFVSGSQTAAQSVKGMAKSILESVLKMATNKLASSIFGMVLGAVGGGGKQIYSSPIGPTMPSTGSFLGLNSCGYVRNMAGGGSNPNRDSVPTLLRPGEYVLRNQAVEAIGRDNLDTINALGARTISQAGDSAQQASNNNGGMTVTNVYVISPDQKPGLTKNDVIVTIADNINTGGSIKKLVKSVVSGG